jgi:hypothetical protein
MSQSAQSHTIDGLGGVATGTEGAAASSASSACQVGALATGFTQPSIQNGIFSTKAMHVGASSWVAGLAVDL